MRFLRMKSRYPESFRFLCNISNIIGQRMDRGARQLWELGNEQEFPESQRNQCSTLETGSLTMQPSWNVPSLNLGLKL